MHRLQGVGVRRTRRFSAGPGSAAGGSAPRGTRRSPSRPGRSSGGWPPSIRGWARNLASRPTAARPSSSRTVTFGSRAPPAWWAMSAWPSRSCWTNSSTTRRIALSSSAQLLLADLGQSVGCELQPDRRPDDATDQEQEDGRGRQDRASVPTQELPEPIGRRGGRRLDGLVGQVALRSAARGWPSGSAAIGPSPGTSSRSSPARRAPRRGASSARGRGFAAIDGSSSVDDRRMLGVGGSSSRIIRRSSQELAPPIRLRCSGVVPVSSS